MRYQHNMKTKQLCVFTINPQYDFMSDDADQALFFEKHEEPIETIIGC